MTLILGAITAIMLALGALLREFRNVLTTLKDIDSDLEGTRTVLARFGRYRRDRKNFCAYLEGKIAKLNSSEEWHTSLYVELQANVEANGTPGRIASLLGRSSARREPNLSKALRRSREPLIVLQGEPGSGKSVALRTVALRLLQKAKRSRRPRVVVPLYINLKGLQAGPTPTSSDIESYVLESLTAGCTVREAAFLKANFVRNLDRGLWLFLLDSFDEIPAILKSENYERVVESYSEAIVDFLNRPVRTRCRGVLASRYFRGPKRGVWTPFRVLPLNGLQQQRMLRRSGIGRERSKRIVLELAASTGDVARDANLPLMLGLIAEHLRLEQTDVLPRLAHDLFDGHIARQMKMGQEISTGTPMSDANLLTAARSIAVAMLLTKATPEGFRCTLVAIISFEPACHRLSGSFSTRVDTNRKCHRPLRIHSHYASRRRTN